MDRLIRGKKEIFTKEPENAIDIAVIVLTYNEAIDIQGCLESICSWAKQIFIVDSGSTDETINIGKNFTNLIFQNAWITFAQQREWAVTNLPIGSDWVLFLDADERATPEVRKEIEYITNQKNRTEKGYYIKRRFYFLDRWLKHGGYYPLAELRLFKHQYVQFVNLGGGARERFVVNGPTGTLQNDFLHIFDKSIQEWISKHIKLAKLEAKAGSDKILIRARFGTKDWIRNEIWARLPRFIRPFLLFSFRYFVLRGFLDGIPGFYFCFLNTLWYPILSEIFYYEECIKKL